MIADIIEQKKDEIAALCRKHRIRRLFLFGSATSDEFDPEASDFDFLVDLGEYDDDVARRYVDLANGLEALLDRAVDLVSVGGLTKARFREEVERTRVLIYEADINQAAA